MDAKPAKQIKQPVGDSANSQLNDDGKLTLPPSTSERPGAGDERAALERQLNATPAI